MEIKTEREEREEQKKEAIRQVKVIIYNHKQKIVELKELTQESMHTIRVAKKYLKELNNINK